MADANLTALTEDSTPLGSDLMYGVSSGTTDFKRYLGDDNLLPEGHMVNGKISVTVATNNITVALKTKSGGNPSATDPVSVWINGSFRTCTAALSVTKNAGTNWFGSGGASFATLEQDYFVYLVWNTTPATDIMDIMFARIPYGAVYSDFSGTTTNEKYGAYGNASAPASTDNCVVIGRFAATLSATASFNWSVPTYTSANLIQSPIYETRTLTYVPTWASSGTAVALGDGLLVGQFIMRGRYILLRVKLTMGATTTYGTGTYNFVIPFTAKTTTNLTYGCYGYAYDNSTTTMYIANGNIPSGGTAINSMQTHGNASPVGQLVPMTFAASDQITMTGEYPIA